MSKKKSLFVTILVAALTAAVLFGLYDMNRNIFSILVGILAVYGFLNAGANFCHWLGKEPVLLPAHVKSDDDVQIDVGAYEDILAEMRGETNE